MIKSKSLESFFNRLSWLPFLMGSYAKTLVYLIRAKGKPHQIGKIQYDKSNFIFRNSDLTALKEVLYDNEYKFLAQTVDKKNLCVVIDIGAHIGTFARYLHKLNDNIQITAVEASPSSYELLKKNLSFAFKQNTWLAINRAAWKNDDNVTFSTKGDTMTNNVSADGDTIIKGITLNDIIIQTCNFFNSPISIMKIDIEGSEEKLFDSLNHNLLSHIETIVIELHPDRCDTKNILSTLSKHYKTMRLINNRIDSKPLLYCTNKIIPSIE